MIEWVRSPVKLAIALVIAAVAITWLVVPGAGLAIHARRLDREQAAFQARLQPIAGEVIRVELREADDGRRLFLHPTLTYQAQPPERPAPLTGTSTSGSVRIHRHGEVPPGTPKPGDAIALWYDPQSAYLTDADPRGGTVSARWIGLVLLGVGVLGLVLAVALAWSATGRALTSRRP